MRMYRSVLENKDFVRWSQEGVVLLVAHNELGHEEKQETDSYGNAVKRCTLYPGLACADHLNAAVDIDNARADGLVKVPFVELCPNTWLVSPTGEVSRVSEEEQFVPGKIRERVEALQKSLGAAVPRKDFAALADDAAKADTAIEESRYRDALLRLSALGKALKTPHAALETFIGARLASIDKYVTYDFEDVRDKPTLAAAEKRAQIQVLLQVVDVEVLGARLACHAAMKAWLAPK